jgi:hypothetical protein
VLMLAAARMSWSIMSKLPLMIWYKHICALCTHLARTVMRSLRPNHDMAAACSCRAAWHGSLTGQAKVADARLSAHLGVAEDYALFRKVTGTAAIEQAVAELNDWLAKKGAFLHHATTWLCTIGLQARSPQRYAGTSCSCARTCLASHIAVAQSPMQPHTIREHAGAQVSRWSRSCQAAGGAKGARCVWRRPRRIRRDARSGCGAVRCARDECCSRQLVSAL